MKQHGRHCKLQPHLPIELSRIRTPVVSEYKLNPKSIDEISEEDPLMTLPRLFTMGTINTIMFPCLIDTGAATNLLSLVIYEALPDQPQLTNANIEFNTAAGTQLDVVGRALCNIQIADKVTATPFYVVRNLVGAALLGMPYLTQAGVIIHVATHQIEFADDERTPIPTTTAPDLTTVSAVVPTTLRLLSEHSAVNNHVTGQSTCFSRSFGCYPVEYSSNR